MKFFIIILVLLVIVITAIFIYRYQIFQYSAETIIRKLLPDYIRIDKINFDLKNSNVIFGDFKILNPEGFSNRYLLEIQDITCRYKMRGKNLLDGIEIVEPSFKRPTLNIERLSDGRLNLNEIKKSFEDRPKEEDATKGLERQDRSSKIIGDKTLADIIKLPETFTAKDGKLIFIDRLTGTKPHLITFENIDGKLSLKLDDSYSKVISLSSTGKGNLNGNQNEVIRWTIFWNPITPLLTMSNRFEVSNVDILPFEPYYDKYSPFIFKKGQFSGTLVFDFDNGNIGSTNEVHLSNFLFYIKRGYENAEFWETSVPDLAKYFTSSFGEIVFDFKIKGEMSNPKFYLGPISKQAIASMAIDKISSAIQKVASPQTQQSGAQAPKTDIEKAKEYIDLFKGLIKKK